MLILDSKGRWYGKLRIDDSETPVIYDPRLPPSIRGCIYLYNAERDAIVQYVWEIVRKSLVTIENSERKALKKELEGNWKIRRREFLKERLPSVSRLRTKRQTAPQPQREANWDFSEENEYFALEDFG